MQVERQLAHTVSIEGIADRSRDGVHRATLQTVAGHDRVAAHDFRTGVGQHAHGDVLQWLAVVPFDERR